MSRSKSRTPKPSRRQRDASRDAPPVTTEHTHVTDPWWGSNDTPLAAKGSVERVAADTASMAAAAANRVAARAATAPAPARTKRQSPPAPRKRSIRRVRRKPKKRSLIVAILAGALRMLADRVKQSARLRQIGARGVIVLIVLIGVCSAVGVIMLNNVVIGRTAELGKLDTRRRELRTEQAIQAADAAKLSAPPRISAYARNKLHMVPAPQSTYIYLDPANARLQPDRRIRLQRAAEQRDNQAAHQATTPPKAPTKEASP